MSSFGAACEEVRDALLSNVLAGAGEAVVERVSDPRRIEEAEAVAPCVERFAEYELDPPKGKGVGRATKVTIIPPLGGLLAEKKVKRLDDSQLSALREAIAAALAWGYLGIASAGKVRWGDETVDPRVDVDPAELWKIWVMQLFSGLGGDDDASGAARVGSGPLDGVEISDGGEHDGALRGIRGKASDRLTATLEEFGLMPKRIKRMRLKMVEQKYVDAGMILWVIQGTAPPGGPSAAGFVEKNWPFERQPG